MLRSFLSTQFLGFLMVGTTAASVNWLSRLAMAQWMSFGIAVLAAYAIGMIVAFALNRAFIFPNANAPIEIQIRRFIFINLSSIPLVWGGALAFVELLRSYGLKTYVEELAHALALALPILGTFLLYKYFAFKEQRS
jgi:putative flippase GtrA